DNVVGGQVVQLDDLLDRHAIQRSDRAQHVAFLHGVDDPPGGVWRGDLVSVVRLLPRLRRGRARCRGGGGATADRRQAGVVKENVVVCQAAGGLASGKNGDVVGGGGCLDGKLHVARHGVDRS